MGGRQSNSVSVFFLGDVPEGALLPSPSSLCKSSISSVDAALVYIIFITLSYGRDSGLGAGQPCVSVRVLWL